MHARDYLKHADHDSFDKLSAEDFLIYFFNHDSYPDRFILENCRRKEAMNQKAGATTEKRKTSEAQIRAVRKWQRNHQEQYNAYVRGWHARNPDKTRKAAMKWRANHLMEYRTYQREWQRRRRANKDRGIVQCQEVLSK